MSEQQREDSKLSTNQEYLIAFLVIGLFGLMYLFFMHGDDLDLNAKTIINDKVTLVESDPVKTDDSSTINLKQEDVQKRRDAKAALDKQNAQEASQKISQIDSDKTPLATQALREESINSSYAVNLLNNIKNEKAKSEKLALKLTKSENLIKAERLRADAAEKKLADFEKLKSTFDEKGLAQQKALKLAEVERVKAESQLVKIQLQKNEEQQALLNRIKIAQEAIAEQKGVAISESITQPTQTVRYAPDSFESSLVDLLNNRIPQQALTFDRVFFESGSDILNAESNQQVEAVANILKTNGFGKVLLQGHTDRTGIESSNLALSLGRSINIKRKLVSLGVSPGRISVVGLGSSKPIANNSSKEGRKQNRRIDLLLLEN